MFSRLNPLFYGPLLALVCVTALADDLAFTRFWDVQTGAAVYGGVKLDSQRVYAGDEAGVLRAIDRETGKVEWTFDAGAAIASNVEVDDLRVYFHTRDGVVHALDKQGGKALWSFATQGERRWDYWDYYLSTPAVDDRQLYFGSGDHHIYAVDKRSGDLRWKVKTGNIVHGQPAVAGEKVIVGGFDGRVYAVDRGTGKVLWTFKTVGNAYFRNGELPGAVTVNNGLVYTGGRDYNVYALLEDTGTGAWNDRTPSWVVGRPLVAGEALIVVNSDGAMVYSYHARSGAVNWEFKNSYNMFSGAQALGTDHVAVAGLDGRITVLSLADGSVAGLYETDASQANRDRYFNDDGTPDYTGLRTLEDLMGFYDRQLQAMGGIPGEIAVDRDVIYYATAGGEIAAVRVGGIELPDQETD
ncbi:MAG: PQQ-like beta-propeller repeat protein [Xanthomonadales bacterium]|nr:PQQ-like beta-propeller repeat protein [Xanthomonadales bacterium]